MIEFKRKKRDWERLATITLVFLSKSFELIVHSVFETQITNFGFKITAKHLKKKFC